jgi:hypothetical protein
VRRKRRAWRFTWWWRRRRWTSFVGDGSNRYVTYLL